MSTLTVRAASLPPPIPGLNRALRKPKKNIPQTKIERDHILAKVREYAQQVGLVPPIPLEELSQHTDKLMAIEGFDAIYRDYIG
ncbi:MAG: polyprenyl synthetase, partial [Verrucomicrobiaceae bacterium]|nr:polyprenyl synthetase [Verrucomicrobiaceae bacterium]